jgi:hypothetical protein
MLTPSYVGHTIIVPVLVSQPMIPEGPPQLQAPTFVLPQGSWSIIWNLVTIFPFQFAAFQEQEGIVIPPNQALSFTNSVFLSGTQWQASIVNDITEDLLPISYIINFSLSVTNQDVELSPSAVPSAGIFSSQDRKVISHDPTIAVSKDPIEGG